MAGWNADKIIVLTALFLSIAAIMNTLIVSQISLQISDLTGRVSSIETQYLQANPREPELSPNPRTRPDLIVSNISFNPSSPYEGDVVIIITTTKNQGNGDAKKDFTVRTEDVTLGTTIGDRNVNSLPKNQSVQTVVTYSNVTRGDHNIRSTADVFNDIFESNENNNVNSRMLFVSYCGDGVCNAGRETGSSCPQDCKADLIVLDIEFSPSNPTPGQNVNITTYVRNVGQLNVIGSFTVRTEDITLNRLLGDRIITGLVAGETKTTNVTYVNVSGGNHTIKSTADIFNNVSESNENNNDRNETISVNPAPTCTDNDRDGYNREGGSCGAVDCNDNNANVNPGRTEVCNQIDDNCNGQIDENNVCGNQSNSTG